MTATQEEYRDAWSTVYWETRDYGFNRLVATEAADTATDHFLDELEDA